MENKHPIKPPVLLKTILDVAFWLLIFGLIGGIAVTAFYYFRELPSNLSINGFEITEFTTPIIFGIFCKIIISALIIYVVYLLRKVVRSFYKKELFTSLQITGLKLIGQLIIITTIADLVLDFLLGVFIERNGRVSMEIDASFSSFWFMLALGLFFVLLSGAFKYAAGIQKENELTV